MNTATVVPVPSVSDIDRSLSNGDWQTARTLLSQAILHDSSQALHHQLLGHCCLNLNDPRSAADAYAVSVRLAPTDAAAHACHALALQLCKRTGEAVAAARQALAIAPDDLIALKVLARAALDAGLTVDAMEMIARVLALQPDDVQAREMRDHARAAARRLPSPSVLATASDEDLKVHLRALLEKVGFRRLQRLGFHLQGNDYYSPLNDCDFLEANRDLWSQPPLEPADIDWRRADQLALAREISPYLTELSDVPVTPPADGSAYGWKNNFWENADALVQYGFVRARRPRRYVEIGCGWSSLLLKRALARNSAEGAPCAVTLIEPYPNPKLFRHFPAEWKIRREMIQRTDLAVFAGLEAGDVLFYDGSHCSKVASDVNWFFFRVLPVIKPGVIVHLHDISLPHEYPNPWIFERGQTWNEQYVLQAFLMHNRDYTVLIGNNYLSTHHTAELRELYHGLQPVYGSSFWMQKTPV